MLSECPTGCDTTLDCRLRPFIGVLHEAAEKAEPGSEALIGQLDQVLGNRCRLYCEASALIGIEDCTPE